MKPSQLSTTFSAQQIITTDALGAASVFAADLNNDGWIDVLSASFGDNMIAWYQNYGNDTFSVPQVITMDAQSAASVFAADLNNDDLLSRECAITIVLIPCNVVIY